VEGRTDKTNLWEVNEIKSWEIGKLVMNRLRKIDPVSYLLFASVYRDFQTIHDFEQEIRILREEQLIEKRATIAASLGKQKSATRQTKKQKHTKQKKIKKQKSTRSRVTTTSFDVASNMKVI
jgi:biopolymer transport protein ExbB/TolQ